ncbi:MAG: MBL fold metallo-hydrolase [Paracoccaceae bacterium]
MTPDVHAAFDPVSNTVSYIVAEPGGPACAIVDPVLGFDAASGRTDVSAAEGLLARVAALGLTVAWVVETHVHADHLSAAPFLQERTGARIGIGAGIRTVQDTFGKIFNEGTAFQRDGSQFDALFEDGDGFEIGALPVRAMHTPGHTPACMTYVAGDAAFVGDTLFMPDGGSARADFPGGDAGTLWDSIQRVLALPLSTRLFICHDYGPGGRAIAWETTVEAQRRDNIHVGGDATKDGFVKMRTERDAQLSMPKLIVPSLQVNMRAGRMPEPDEDGRVFLKLPVNGL